MCYKKKAKEMLQTFDNATLASVSRGEVNLNLLAREELTSRGFDREGKWVGVQKAKMIHAVGFLEGIEG